MRGARALILCVAALAMATLAPAQGITTGTVSGTVTDPSGAVIPGAQVRLTNQANGLALEAQSNGEGVFNFFAVPIGTYRVAVTAKNFSLDTVNDVHVLAGATTNLNNIELPHRRRGANRGQRLRRLSA